MSMKLLNVGCGATFHPSWTNMDLVACAPGVLEHDVRQGLPFPDNNFDACYSSHTLEHFTSQEANRLLREFHRVLRPGGILRIAVPDVEGIARAYLQALERVDTGVIEAQADHAWMLLELYDQSVRGVSGGEMGRYLTRKDILNEKFVMSRLGQEVLAVRQNAERRTAPRLPIWSHQFRSIWRRMRVLSAKILVSITLGQEGRGAFEEGLFRASGEIHRCMYDRVSLRRLLGSHGFINIQQCNSQESRIADFNDYRLDFVEGRTRKPDSLFMEGQKA